MMWSNCELLSRLSSNFCAILLGAAFCLISCGTISGTRHIMSVDTLPRGAEAYVKDTRGSYRLLGTTPLFIETQSARQTEVFFRVSEKELQGYAQKCEWRWQEAFIPDGVIVAPFLIASSPVSLEFIAVVGGTDIYNRAFYDCGINFNAKLDEGVLTKKKICKRLIVIPPKNDTEAGSKAISHKWAALARDRLQDCDEVVISEELKNALAYYNIDYLRSFTFQSLTRKQVFGIGIKTRATHMVFLEAKDPKDQDSINSEVYDLHTSAKEDGLSFAFKMESSELKGSNNGKKDLSKYFHLFPNAMTFGYTNNQFFVHHPNIIFKNEVHHEFIPKLVSGVGIDSIEHPRGFKIWDIMLVLYPSLKIFYDDVDTEVLPCPSADQTKCQGDFTKYHYVYYAAMPLMNAGYIFHTPAGAFSFGTALGLKLGRFRDNRDYTINQLEIATGIQTGYFCFLTDSAYLFVSASTLNGGGKPNSDFYKQSSIRQIYFGLGYFMPKFRGNLKDLSDRWMHALGI